MGIARLTGTQLHRHPALGHSSQCLIHLFKTCGADVCSHVNPGCLLVPGSHGPGLFRGWGIFPAASILALCCPGILAFCSSGTGILAFLCPGTGVLVFRSSGTGALVHCSRTNRVLFHALG